MVCRPAMKPWACEGEWEAGQAGTMASEPMYITALDSRVAEPLYITVSDGRVKTTLARDASQSKEVETTYDPHDPYVQAGDLNLAGGFITAYRTKLLDRL
ncbi:hypothetical protein AK812_SmicGene46052 [Symbiodinium microadriaticum]|uniref:Uncharacterized protein n=1 Tax=Symbiodinium microadriaticum TaxID=2951 RepID=A0A1Q9BUN3_SYMMI|nr:hypothetical protein AK812_SmicGene46052 [Symbiodinium microadriaticum]